MYLTVCSANSRLFCFTKCEPIIFCHVPFGQKMVDQSLVPFAPEYRKSSADQYRGPGHSRPPAACGGARQLQGSAVGAGAPEDVASAAIVDPAAEHEEVVREAVQVFERFRVDRLAGGELTDQALGSPRDRPRAMEVGGSRRATGQDERVERP